VFGARLRAADEDRNFHPRPSSPSGRTLGQNEPLGAVYHGYTVRVAKVMVSIPDDLLAEVDSEAARTGTSRSAVLRSFADGALRNRRLRRAETMNDLLDRARNHGGGAAQAVKATRPS
jgi:hypothetical protein